ncbi:chemotaxis protein CheC [Thalassobacillus hwangdonensis]|uniref:Chemotaxis protein CheC n=1 Tax=Thalassobacillus hwangdonensis TaxID=546108 RepID=A0ABW3KZ15_9BACI
MDVLKEIGNIGAGHAATSLSQLLQHKVEMHVPSVRMVDFDEMMELGGGAEKKMVSVFLRMEGDAPGSMFFVLSPEQARRFVSMMIHSEDVQFDQPPYDELAISALHELGNILTGSYLSSLADFTNLDLHPSVPSIAIDMVGATLSFGLIELSQVSDQAIVIETCLSTEETEQQDVKGHFFLLPDPGSYEKVFRSLGVETDE